jgi:hypothetical protein
MSVTGLAERLTHASEIGQILLAHVVNLRDATETDAGAAAGRGAVHWLGQTLAHLGGDLADVLTLWNTDRSARLDNLTEPSALHLTNVLAWRSWFFATRLLAKPGPPYAINPGEWLAGPGLLDELSQRWPVVRRMVRQGLPTIDRDSLAADLHNETAAMLRSPFPVASIPTPVLGPRKRQFMASIESTPPYFWQRSDDELIAWFDSGGSPAPSGGAVPQNMNKPKTAPQLTNGAAALAKTENAPDGFAESWPFGMQANLPDRKVWRQGDVADLATSAPEWDALCKLAKNYPNRTHTKQLQRGDTEPGSVFVAVSKLRTLLAILGLAVDNVRNDGYLLIELEP